MEHIQQSDDYSCVVACLAMVTARPLKTVRRELGRNVCPGCGVSDAALNAYLGRHGYAQLRKTEKQYFIPKDQKRWPPAPFADLHIATVQETGHAQALHAVVLLRDGTVLDPELQAPVTLAHYYLVADVTGIIPVTAPKPKRRARQ